MRGNSSHMALDTSAGGTPVADRSSIRALFMADFPQICPLSQAETPYPPLALRQYGILHYQKSVSDIVSTPYGL
jgi:hypothetical protein